MTQLDLCTTYHSKSIHFWKALQGIQNCFIFVVGASLKALWLIKIWNFVKKCQIFIMLYPTKFKARFVSFKPWPIYTIVCWGSHPCFTENLQGEKRRLTKNNFFISLTFWSAVFRLTPITKIMPFFESLKKELYKNVKFYYGRVYTFHVVPF